MMILKGKKPVRKEDDAIRESRRRMAFEKERLEQQDTIKSLRAELIRWRGMVAEQKTTIERWKKEKDDSVSKLKVANTEKREIEEERDRLQRSLEREIKNNKKLTRVFSERTHKASIVNFYEGMAFGLVTAVTFMIGMHII